MNESEKQALLAEINSVKAHLQSIETHLLHAAIPNEAATTFLISEFEQLGEFWRQTDSRLETSINHYLVSWTAIAAGTAFLSSIVSSPKVFWGILALLAVVLASGGYIVSTRTLSASMVKREYLLALNLIRLYFVERDKSIASYLLLPYQDPRIRPELIGLGPSGKTKFSFGFLSGLNSLLLGVACGISTWLLFPSVSLIVPLAVAITVAGFCLIVLSAIRRKVVSGFNTTMMSRLQELTPAEDSQGKVS